MSETKKTEAAPATKSAADLLIEMQLEEKRKASTNPLVVVSEEVVTPEKEDEKVAVAVRKVFADGAVLETFI